MYIIFDPQMALQSIFFILLKENEAKLWNNQSNILNNCYDAQRRESYLLYLLQFKN